MSTSIILETSNIESARAADLFAALGDPARLRIVGVLADSQRCVCDIQEAVPLAPNLLSYHLRVLRQAGLIEGSRRGRWIDYHLAPDAAGLIAGALATAGFAAVVDQPVGAADHCEVRK